MPITAISPTPVAVGKSHEFTVVVVPWDDLVTTYTAVFLRAEGKAGSFKGNTIEVDENRLNIVLVSAAIPNRDTLVGRWKLTFQKPDASGSLLIEIDSQPSATFEIHA